MNKFVKTILIACLIYFGIAGITFAVRHPWSTSMQQWMCLKEILLFQTVDRNEIDPR